MTTGIRRRRRKEIGGRSVRLGDLFVGGAIVALSAAVPTAVGAQSPWSAELRLGGGVGAYEPAAAGLEFQPGFAWRASVAYALSGWLAAQLGYGSMGFRCDEGFCSGRDARFRSAGLDVGLEATISGATAVPRVRAATVLYRTTESWREPPGVGKEDTSDRVVGFELAVGWSLPLSRRFAISPGLRFATYTASFPGEEPEEGRLNHLAAEVGLRFHPGG